VRIKRELYEEVTKNYLTADSKIVWIILQIKATKNPKESSNKSPQESSMLTSKMPQESSPRKHQKAIRKLQRKEKPPKTDKMF